METGNNLVDRYWRTHQQNQLLPTDRKLGEYYDIFYMLFLDYLCRSELVDRRLIRLKPKGELMILNPALVPALKALAFVLFDSIIGPYQMSPAFDPDIRFTIFQMYSASSDYGRNAYCVLNRGIQSINIRRTIPWGQYCENPRICEMLLLEYQKRNGMQVNEAKLRELKRLTNFY
jgi:hypothetical protein